MGGRMVSQRDKPEPLDELEDFAGKTMRLYLMRHGIAIDREDVDCPPEPERYLTPKGIQRTRAAARGLRDLRIKPASLLSSPYVRAVQTGEIVCEVVIAQICVRISATAIAVRKIQTLSDSSPLHLSMY